MKPAPVHYNGLFFVNGYPKHDTSHGTVAIPMVLGFKGRIAPHFILGLEAGARYSFFADDLDGSGPTNKGLASLKFGNINSTDWYVFTDSP